MKAFLRSGPVQALFGILLGGYLWLVLKTVRWTIVNRGPVDALLADPKGFIVCFWHGRIAASIGAQPLCRPLRDTRLIISLSEDVEFIARAMELMDLPAFRGSSRRTKDPRRRYSGGAVYRQSLDWVRRADQSRMRACMASASRFSGACSGSANRMTPQPKGQGSSMRSQLFSRVAGVVARPNSSTAAPVRDAMRTGPSAICSAGPRGPSGVRISTPPRRTQVSDCR